MSPRSAKYAREAGQTYGQHRFLAGPKPNNQNHENLTKTSNN